VPAEELRGAARLYATGGNGAIYYGLGVTEHSQGSTTVMAIANLAMLTGNIGRRRRRREPAARPEQRAGLLRHGLVPARTAGLPPRQAPEVREIFESLGASRSTPSRACASPTCWTPPSTGTFKGIYIQGEDILQSDPDTKHVAAGSPRWNA
jgi:formate dehydrogenase major subunit